MTRMNTADETRHQFSKLKEKFDKDLGILEANCNLQNQGRTKDIQRVVNDIRDMLKLLVDDQHNFAAVEELWFYLIKTIIMIHQSPLSQGCARSRDRLLNLLAELLTAFSNFKADARFVQDVWQQRILDQLSKDDGEELECRVRKGALSPQY